MKLITEIVSLHAVPARNTNGPDDQDANLKQTYNEVEEEVRDESELQNKSFIILKRIVGFKILG